MRAFDSSTGRLMLAVLTAAIGLQTLRTQSDVWLGALAMLTAGWLVVGLAAGLAGRGRRRVFWLAFVVVGTGSLALAFGPVSDARFRGAVLHDAAFYAKHQEQLLPTTRALLWLSQFAKPHGRASILMSYKDGRPSISLAILSHQDVNGSLEVLSETLDREILDDIMVFSRTRPDFPTRSAYIFPDLSIYFHAGHLLLSLALGALAGLIAASVSRPRRDDPANAEVRDHALIGAPRS